MRRAPASAFLAVHGETSAPDVAGDRAMIDGIFRPAGYSPDAICCRSASAISASWRNDRVARLIMV